MLSRIACLGPEGSFSHLVTLRRFPHLEPELLPSIEEVFTWLNQHPEAQAIVPIENSSGGIIFASLDRLMDPSCPFHVQEELSLNVRLALLGRTEESINVIYSHAMPFFHCDEWLKQNYPDVKRVPVASTSNAAERAAHEKGAAAIGHRGNAQRHNIEILHFPIEESTINVTQFFLIGQNVNPVDHSQQRSGYVVDLPDHPGSLCNFLQPLANAQVSLKRIVSRPVRGCPNQYRFYIEIEGNSGQSSVAQAITDATQQAVELRCIGCFSTGTRYES